MVASTEEQGHGSEQHPGSRGEEAVVVPPDGGGRGPAWQSPTQRCWGRGRGGGQKQWLLQHRVRKS